MPYIKLVSNPFSSDEVISTKVKFAFQPGVLCWINPTVTRLVYLKRKIICGCELFVTYAVDPMNNVTIGNIVKDVEDGELPISGPIILLNDPDHWRGCMMEEEGFYILHVVDIGQQTFYIYSPIAFTMVGDVVCKPADLFEDNDCENVHIILKRIYDIFHKTCNGTAWSEGSYLIYENENLIPVPMQ